MQAESAETGNQIPAKGAKCGSPDPAVDFLPTLPEGLSPLGVYYALYCNWKQGLETHKSR